MDLESLGLWLSPIVAWHLHRTSGCLDCCSIWTQRKTSWVFHMLPACIVALGPVLVSLEEDGPGLGPGKEGSLGSS